MTFGRHLWLALLVPAIALAACGGGDSGTSGIPTLAGTPYPTVPAVIPTEPICTTTAVIPMPPNFPSEIPVPPGYTVWSVSTTPYLHVEGRVTPPDTGTRQVPKGIVSDAINYNLQRANWTLKFNPQHDGLDFEFFSADDTKHGHYDADHAIGCPGQVVLIYDIFWLTP
jgi:hypothetical protein